MASLTGPWIDAQRDAYAYRGQQRTGQQSTAQQSTQPRHALAQRQCLPWPARLRPKRLPVLPSDHFGLVFTMRRRKKAAQQ